MPDEPLLELREVMRRLRAECPWKAAQTHRSLVRYLVEELHETVDAVETGTPDDLAEELGDLLLQVYFHAAIAEETGAFTLDDVAAGIVAKMRRRNPHVFGDAGEQHRAASAAEVNELWEQVKATEKQRDDVTDGIAPTLPGLLYADKVVDRLGRAGRPVSVEPTIVLVPSPLLGPATWLPVAWWLRGRGREVEVVDLGDAPRTPAAVIAAVVAAAAGRPVVLVPHSNAGRFAASLAEVVDVRGTIYVDAALPRADGSPAPLAPEALLEVLAPLADDGVLPPWTRWWPDDALAATFPDAASRAAVEAEQPRVSLAYLRTPLGAPPGWTTQPAAYLAFGTTYDDEVAQAREAGWPVAVLDGAHLHTMVAPATVGRAVLDLLDRLTGREAVGDRILALVVEAHEAGADPEQELRAAVRRLLLTPR